MPRQYDARNDVLPCWIGPSNCQLKWLRTRSAEIWHEENYFDCWSYHATRWIVNETTRKTVPKLPKSFFEKEPRKLSFLFLNFEVSSVFRRPISDIFIRFHIPLNNTTIATTTFSFCLTGQISYSYSRLGSSPNVNIWELMEQTFHRRSSVTQRTTSKHWPKITQRRFLVLNRPVN